jgi:membrane protein/epoxyqueuosine reductase
MAGVVNDIVNLFMPSNQDFVEKGLVAAVPRHGVQALSMVMILISCTGIFLPLEVALNQAWGIAKSRNYLLNQLVAFGLAIAMVGLALLSILLNTIEKTVVAFILLQHTDWFIYGWVNYAWLAISTGAACIVFLFLIYWLLPNRKVPWRPVLRTSIWTGLVWLAAKYAFVAILPHMDLKALYGPFYVSVGLLFWAYASGLILFAGAQFSVSRWGDKK